MGGISRLFKETWNEWSEDECLQLGSSLAYYALFSLFPLLLLIITLVGFVLNGNPNGNVAECVNGQGEVLAQLPADNTTCNILGSVRSNTSTQIANLVGTTLQSMQEKSAAGGVGAIIGFVTLFLGASGVFGQLDTSFNRIWNVEKPKTEGGIGATIIATIKDKTLAFTMVMGTIFLLLVSMVVSTVITAVSAAFEGVLPGGALLWQAVQTTASIGVVTLAFAAIFRFLPDTHVEWRDVWWGALLTSVLFALLKQLLSWYIGNSGSFAAYGLVGAVLALLTWIYFTSQILFFGGEFTQVYARHYGSRSAQAAIQQQPQETDEQVATAAVLSAASLASNALEREQQARGQRYAFAVGGLLAGVLGTLVAAVVGAIVGIVRGVTLLRRRRA
jgi:membrane protein